MVFPQIPTFPTFPGVVQVDLDHDVLAQQRAEERGERLKALEEPAIGLRFMANPQARGPGGWGGWGMMMGRLPGDFGGFLGCLLRPSRSMLHPDRTWY